MTRVERNGELVEVQKNGETVFSVEDLKQRIESVEGNPEMKEAMLMIVNYLEAEG